MGALLSDNTRGREQLVQKVRQRRVIRDADDIAEQGHRLIPGEEDFNAPNSEDVDTLKAVLRMKSELVKIPFPRGVGSTLYSELTGLLAEAEDKHQRDVYVLHANHLKAWVSTEQLRRQSATVQFYSYLFGINSTKIQETLVHVKQRLEPLPSSTYNRPNSC
jgi:predicted ATPase